MTNVYLPIGINDGESHITELPLAQTGGIAEKIYTKKPLKTKLHTWFGKILAVSIDSIGSTDIAGEFAARKEADQDNIPDLIKKIPFVDVGSLLIQIQRECWDDTLTNQRINCVKCFESYLVTVELNKIDIPKNTGKQYTEIFVDLPNTHTIDGDKLPDGVADMGGMEFNTLKFRVPTLGDAIDHEKIAKDEIMFWKKISLACLQGLYLKTKNSEGEEVMEEVPSRYIGLRGSLLFDRDFSSKTLKKIRTTLQESLPTAKASYEEECLECGQSTPIFASVTSFFLA